MIQANKAAAEVPEHWEKQGAGRREEADLPHKSPPSKENETGIQMKDRYVPCANVPRQDAHRR